MKQASFHLKLAAVSALIEDLARQLLKGQASAKVIFMDEKQRAILSEEYYKLAGFVQAYDSYFISIKNWGVTVSGAAIGVGFSKEAIGQNTQIVIFSIALILSLAFWITEVRFKLLQLAHIYRQSELEQALQDGRVIPSPRILQAYGEGRSFDQVQKRWRSIMFWPQVMFPHVIFTLLSFLLVLIQTARQLRSILN